MSSYDMTIQEEIDYTQDVITHLWAESHYDWFGNKHWCLYQMKKYEKELVRLKEKLKYENIEIKRIII